VTSYSALVRYTAGS